MSIDTKTPFRRKWVANVYEVFCRLLPVTITDNGRQRQTVFRNRRADIPSGCRLGIRSARVWIALFSRRNSRVQFFPPHPCKPLNSGPVMFRRLRRASALIAVHWWGSAAYSSPSTVIVPQAISTVILAPGLRAPRLSHPHSLRGCPGRHVQDHRRYRQSPRAAPCGGKSSTLYAVVDGLNGLIDAVDRRHVNARVVLRHPEQQPLGRRVEVWRRDAQRPSNRSSGSTRRCSRYRQSDRGRVASNPEWQRPARGGQALIRHLTFLRPGDRAGRPGG